MQRRSFPTVSILLGTSAKTALPGGPFRLGRIRLSRVLWLSVLMVMLGGLLEPEAAAQTVLFGAKTDFGTGATRPYSVAVGDFNGDGTLDLVVANQADSLVGSGNRHGTVSILLGTGTGSFVAKTELRDFFAPVSVAVGDFNGDGKLDLAVAAGTVSILLGTGTGSFGAKTDFGTGASSVAVGDFNGDGKLDLVTTNGGSRTVSILLGTGTGSFGARTDFGTGAGSQSVAVGDFNGDGNLDLAVANYDGDTVSILLGTGTGSFGAKTDFGTGSGPASVAVGDFNGDGKLDLAVTNSGYSFAGEAIIDPRTVSILLGTGAGSFGAKTDFGTGSSPVSVAVGDFNGDGKLDLAVANLLGGTVSILLGTGAGSFGAKTDFGTGSSPVSVAVGDFNGDGKLDLAVANLGSVFVNTPAPGTVSILLNTGPTGPCASTNPIDCTDFFVRQHYLDFLNREPDAGGLAYWSSLITACSPTDQQCINSKRVSVSAAFFIEQEFQLTGNYVYRMYKASYGQRPSYAQFMPDRARINPDASQIEASKQQFADLFVQRPEFLAKYPSTLTPEAFVDALIATVKSETNGAVDLAAQRNALLTALQTSGRGSVVRQVAENKAFQTAEYNKAFVTMQYFGYLRRDPEDAGYNFWLDVLNNRVQNNYRGMVCAFITSAEYQLRFSSVVTRNDSICGNIGP